MHSVFKVYQGICIGIYIQNLNKSVVWFSPNIICLYLNSKQFDTCLSSISLIFNYLEIYYFYHVRTLKQNSLNFHVCFLKSCFYTCVVRGSYSGDCEDCVVECDAM
jgi:hypothetical protein